VFNPGGWNNNRQFGSANAFVMLLGIFKVARCIPNESAGQGGFGSLTVHEAPIIKQMFIPFIKNAYI
jgi:hypothetical protein